MGSNVSIKSCSRNRCQCSLRLQWSEMMCWATGKSGGERGRALRPPPPLAPSYTFPISIALILLKLFALRVLLQRDATITTIFIVRALRDNCESVHLNRTFLDFKLTFRYIFKKSYAQILNGHRPSTVTRVASENVGHRCRAPLSFKFRFILITLTVTFDAYHWNEWYAKLHLRNRLPLCRYTQKNGVPHLDRIL